MQRSGTTYLHAMLQQRLDTVIFQPELWAESFFGSFMKGWLHNDEGYIYAPYVWSALFQSRIDAESLNPSSLMFAGAKANFNSHKSLDAIAKSWSQGFSRIRPIGIVRSDQIAKLASHVRAQRTGNWHQWTAKDDPGSKFTVHIKLNAHARRHIVSSILADRKLQEFIHAQNGLVLSYEDDLLKSPEKCIRKVESFLGMVPYQYNFEIHKKLAPPPEQYIENYHKLCHYSQKMERLATEELEQEFLRSERTVRHFTRIKHIYSRLLRLHK